MKYFFANWKMYHTYQESSDLIDNISLIQDSKDVKYSKDVISVYFPNDLALKYAVQKLGTSQVGAQNVAWVPAGAYTGATSAYLYKEAGASYALVGHSERRYIFNETNDAVRSKMEACIDAGIVPVLCIGETQKDREEDKRDYRIKKQLISALKDLDLKDTTLFIAYEPVWAIGSGEPCLAQEAGETADFIRAQLKEIGVSHSNILYGGSVDASNMVSYFATGKIDGLLVGSAASKKETLNQMLEVMNN